MANKDHLPTNEENTKRQKRDLKRIVSTNYQSAPPVLTQDITDTGTVARTTGEVRDTDFPILENIEDLTDNLQTAISAGTKTIKIELGKQEAQFHRLLLDDDGGSITAFVIDFIGLAKNKALEFIADIETQFTGTPTITFNPTLDALPPAFGDTGSNKFKMLVSAIDTPVVTSYQVINGEGGSSIGASFPILWPKENLTPGINETATIDISLTTGNAKQIQFPAGDINFAISNPPSGVVAESVVVTFIQDVTGGRSLTTVDGAIKNGTLMDGLLDKTENRQTTFRFTTHDLGVTYHAELVDLSTGATITSLNDLTDVSITSPVTGHSLIFNGSIWTEANVSLSTIIIDTTKNWNAQNITNLGDLSPTGNSIKNLGNASNQWNNLWIDILENQTEITISPPTLSITAPVINLGGDDDDAIHFIGKAATDLNMSTFDIEVIDRLTFMFNASTFGTALTQSLKGFSSLLNGVRLNLLVGAVPDPNGSFVVALEEDPLFEVESVNRNLILYETDFKIFHDPAGTGETLFGITKSSNSTNLDDTDKIFLSINGVTVMDIVSDEIALGNSVSISNVDQIGFRKIGNLIEDSDTGVRFVVRPFNISNPDLGEFRWANTIEGVGDATNIFATLDNLGFSINTGYLQMGEIAVPDNPPTATGRLFFDSGNASHLTIKRVGSTFDLEANWSTFLATTDVDMDTFSIFDIDSLQFIGGAVDGIVDSVIGITTIGNTGLRIQVREDGKFQINEDTSTVIPFEIDTDTEQISFNDYPLLLLNSAGGGFLQIESTDDFATFDTSVKPMLFSIAGTNILRIEDDGLAIQDGKNVAGVGTLGMVNLGQGIESTDATNMTIVSTATISFHSNTDNFEFAHFSAENPTTTPIPFLSMGPGMIILSSIVQPGDSGAATVGRIFMDSTNSNHLSIKRLGVVTDLEVGDASAWSTFIATQPVDFSNEDAINVRHLLFVPASQVPATAAGIGGLTNGLQFNVPAGDAFFWFINGLQQADLFVGSGAGDAVFELRSRNAEKVPRYRIFNLDALVSAGSEIGQYEFYAKNNNNDTTSFASISAFVEDVTDDTEYGSLHLNVEVAGTEVTFLSLNDAKDGVVKIYKDLNFNNLDARNVNQILFQSPGTNLITTDTGMVASTQGLTANVPLEKGYIWGSNNIPIMGVFHQLITGNTVLEIFSTTNGSVPEIKTFSLDSTLTAGVAIATMEFAAKNSALVDTTYAGLQIDLENFTDATEEGSLSLLATTQGSPVTFLSINNSADGKITAWRDLTMDAGRDITISLADLTTRGVIHTATTFNFAVNGAIWLDDTSGKLMGREGGANFQLSAGGGGGVDLLPLDNIWTGNNTFASGFLVIEQNTDNTITVLKLIRNDETVGDDSILADIEVFGKNDNATPEEIRFSRLDTIQESETDGAEEGSMGLRLIHEGVETTFIRINDDGEGLVRYFRPIKLEGGDATFIDFRTPQSPVLVGNPPGTNDNRIFSDSTNSNKLSVIKSDGNVIPLENFPLNFPEISFSPANSTRTVFFASLFRHARKYTLNTNITFSFIDEPANKTAYVNLIVVQDNTGGHTVTLPAGTVNKDIVESGVLQGPNEETGIVIKWSFGTFYAFLETGNRVSGGGSGGASALSGLTIDTSKDWEEFNITNIGDIIPNGDGAKDLGDSDHIWDILWVEKLDGGTIDINSSTFNINSGTFSIDSGTINIGDTSGDDINFKGRANSDLVPETTATHDLGIDTFNWQDLWVRRILSDGSLIISPDGNIELQSSEIVLGNSTAQNITFTAQVKNAITFENVGTPSTVASTGKFYSKVVTGVSVPHWLDSNGVETPLIGTAGGSNNQIFEGNTSVTVTDTGSNGNVITLIEGVQKYSIDSNSIDIAKLPMRGITEIDFFEPAGATGATLGQETINVFSLDLKGATSEFKLEFDGVIAFGVDEDKTNIFSRTPDVSSAKLSLFRADASSAIGSTVGEIQFRGNSLSPAIENQEYGKIEVDITNTSSVTPSSILRFWHQSNGFNVNILSLTEGRLNLTSHVDGTPTSQIAEMRIIREDSSPSNGVTIGDLDFIIFDTPAFTPYVTLRAIAKNIDPGNEDAGLFTIKIQTGGILEDALTIEGSTVNNSSEFLIKTAVNGPSRIEPDTGNMGYFVTPESGLGTDIGTFGTLQTPHSGDLGSTPTANTLNVAFGNFDGAMGFDPVQELFWIRKNVSTWKKFAPV